MTTTAALSAPLAILAANAVGSSGLDGRALGAALWSHTARFELTDAHPWGIADVVRMAPCPLFDGATPYSTRLTSLLSCVLQDAAPDLERAETLHLLAADPQAARYLAAEVHIEARLHSHCGPASFIRALGHIAALPTSTSKRRSHVLVAADSLLSAELLEPLYATGRLSTEQQPEGIIPSEAAAMLTLMQERDALASGLPILGTIRGACGAAFDASPSQALMTAIKGAVPDTGPAVQTVLWDIGDHGTYLAAVAETISLLEPVMQAAHFIRPLQYIGCTGVAFGPVATVLALEGSRAGIIPQGATLVCALEDNVATALVVEAPWYPHIMLADAPRPTP